MIILKPGKDRKLAVKYVQSKFQFIGQVMFSKATSFSWHVSKMISARKRSNPISLVASSHFSLLDYISFRNKEKLNTWFSDLEITYPIDNVLLSKYHLYRGHFRYFLTILSFLSRKHCRKRADDSRNSHFWAISKFPSP